MSRPGMTPRTVTASEPSWPPERVPTRLYRYVSAERAISILTEGKLYFCSPSAFNDPFDCRIRPSFQGSKADFRKFALLLATDRSPSSPRKVRRAMVRKVRDKLNPVFFEGVFDKWQKEFLDKSGMLCLTENNNDILMWSHYGDGHRGVCLEFEYRLGKDFFGEALPIRYLSAFPLLSFTETFSGSATRNDFLLEFGNCMFLTKACQWSYEREWRLIDFPTEGFCKFGLR